MPGSRNDKPFPTQESHWLLLEDIEGSRSGCPESPLSLVGSIRLPSLHVAGEEGGGP